jgi:L-seryl-tRNA(Ser) seleniumtransferase
LAALEAVLRLYADPDRLAERLPALRLLARPVGEIRAVGERLLPAVEHAFRDIAEAALVETRSQIGSGALPVSLLPSAALTLQPLAQRSGAAVEILARALRALPVPVIGRIEAGRVLLDLRCLEDETTFLKQLSAISKMALDQRSASRST